MRVGGCKTLLRNESNRWDPQGAPSTGHDPLEKDLS